MGAMLSDTDIVTSHQLCAERLSAIAIDRAAMAEQLEVAIGVLCGLRSKFEEASLPIPWDIETWALNWRSIAAEWRRKAVEDCQAIEDAYEAAKAIFAVCDLLQADRSYIYAGRSRSALRHAINALNEASERQPDNELARARGNA
jgi:hypothetical protein